MKKRGFGAGKWNAPGGKAEEEETAEGAASREVLEEVGLEVQDLEDRGTIEFLYEDPDATTSACRIFVTHTFHGEPVETEEMRPEWFSIDAIPWDTMWESDRIWLPELLVGQTVNYRCYFDNDQKFIRHERRT